MVIGNGMIANRFKSFAEDNYKTIFASGVSDSSIKSIDAFKKERDLLLKSIESYPENKFVYFSTCSIYDPSLIASPYVQHKLEIEEIIKETSNNFIIFRVSNPIGITSNKKTILNYFIEHIKLMLPFVIWKNATRNLIDIDDMYSTCSFFLSDQQVNRQTINIANPLNYYVTDIIAQVEDHLQIQGIYSFVDKAGGPKIDTSHLISIYEELRINFTEQYLKNLLEKYFPKK